MHSIALIGALMPFFAAAINNQNATLYWFETKLDHFASNGNSSTFKMRYLVQEDYWDPVNGPIFFYTGNEGSIWNFYNNTGFMTETLAKEFNALVVFSEHRYFGESFPVSKEMSFTPEYTRYLTVEQVMMDYVLLLKEIKHTWDVEHQPVIAFGGSYGGMLSAWMRMKYPSAI
jgi:pimeloyl-ACP methyl ester carboxylesterase